MEYDFVLELAQDIKYFCLYFHQFESVLQQNTLLSSRIDQFQEVSVIGHATFTKEISSKTSWHTHRVVLFSKR